MCVRTTKPPEEQKGIKLRNGYRVLGTSGGVPPEVIERCLARMQAWVRLAIRTLNVEFPNWETFVGMGFDLDHTLQFRDFGRRKPCKEKDIPPGWPLLDIHLQKKGLGLFDFNATSNGSLELLHPKL